MQKNRLLAIFVVVFIDLLGFSLILPLLPYYAESYGADPTLIGFLVASYAAAQFVGTPILGRLSDRYGRRPILLLSVGGTFVGFLLLGFAQLLGRGLAVLVWPAAANVFVLGILFASRILDGVTGGNISVAQAYISDVTDEKNRAKGLGMIGAAFGLGFIIGPAVGGLLSRWGYDVPAFVAAALSFLNLLMIFFWLPESLSAERQAVLAKLQRPSFTLGALREALSRARVGPLLQIRFFFGLAFAIFQTIFALYAQYRLSLDAQTTGYVLAYVGLLSVIVQGFAVGRMVARFAETRMIFVSLLLMTVGLVAWAVTPNLPILLLVIAVLALAGGTLNTILSSTLSKSVYPEEIGGTLGLAAALESITRVIAPSLGGFLLQSFGAWSPGVVAGVLVAWAAWVAWQRLIVRPDPPLPARAADAMFATQVE